MPVGLFPIGEAHYYGLTDDASNVTSTNCSSGIQWIYKVLGDCVEDPKGISSVALGLASIFAWMVVSIPQMVKNCRNIAGVEGISILLILQWTLGDATNLVGAILTNQLPLQIYLAIYFVFADLILFSQYLYYQIWKRKQANQQQGSGPRAVPKIVLCFTGAFIGTNLFGAAIYNSPLNRDQNMHIMHHSAGRSLLGTNLHHSAVIFHGFKDQMGYAIGVVSSIFYIGSRSAQLYKNYKRQSTDGLSVLMFWLAILGNLTYGLAILVRQLDSVYVIRHVPWLVGSLGVILLDASLVVQFKYYGSGEDFDRLSQEPLLQDQEIVVNGDHLKYDTIN
ncbi:lysosomal amino acid transporter 1 homolog isoform X2 [Ostrea edulis]|uniref:lysosomal amino acid transporter 1 homolog isoform X2 n=1 Tax=Ostrea edulis TaxID=37623 RepID=UPI0024AF20E1|nr:lysosomal amino acid transporter 1 homolog isoform X2 [Ostrea edulis]XP_056018707.1 lysosomal amino acid transporter 1 homolog isoform X2 [Ostrea edulis]XP_056018714.1 lysosomal amino acid transporter 1 homolog isoform X2 [Ostrea edulis]